MLKSININISCGELGTAVRASFIYEPSSWGWRGGDPAEFEVTSVLDQNGEEILDRLPDDKHSEIEGLCWDARRGDWQDYDAP